MTNGNRARTQQLKFILGSLATGIERPTERGPKPVERRDADSRGAGDDG